MLDASSNHPVNYFSTRIIVHNMQAEKTCLNLNVCVVSRYMLYKQCINAEKNLSALLSSVKMHSDFRLLAV